MGKRTLPVYGRFARHSPGIGRNRQSSLPRRSNAHLLPSRGFPLWPPLSRRMLRSAPSRGSESLYKWRAPAHARHRHRAFAWKTSIVDGEGSRFRDVGWLPEEVLDILDMIAEPAPRLERKRKPERHGRHESYGSYFAVCSLFGSVSFCADGEYECADVYERCRADPTEKLPKLP